MSLKALFPVYPLSLRTPPRSRIKFGTRSVYVDFPAPATYFMMSAMNKRMQTTLTTESVKKEWQKFVEENKDALTYHGRPLAAVSLRTTPFSKQGILRLDIKWNPFIDHLEEKASELYEDTKTNGRNILNVYREIWQNMFSATGLLAGFEPRYTPSSAEDFKKLLDRTADYDYIEQLLANLEDTTNHIESTFRTKIDSIRFYTTNLRMNMQHLRTAVDVVDIPACYLILRNLLEHLVRLFILLDIGESVGTDIVLATMFLYEYEPGKKSSKGIPPKEFVNQTKQKLRRVFAEMRSEQLDVKTIFENFRKEQLGGVWMDKNLIEKFGKEYDLSEAGLDQIHSACSVVIHNQPPLPFFSLLEVKFFKKFLEGYVLSFAKVVGMLIEKEVKLNKPVVHRPSVESVRVSADAASELATRYEQEIVDLIQKSLATLPHNDPFNPKLIWIEPLTLAALFHLISVNWTHLRNRSFTEDDLYRIIQFLQPHSFRSIQYEVRETLSRIQESMVKELEKYDSFSTLSTELKRKVALYLLLLYLPRIVKERLKY